MFLKENQLVLVTKPKAMTKNGKQPSIREILEKSDFWAEVQSINHRILTVRKLTEDDLSGIDDRLDDDLQMINLDTEEYEIRPMHITVYNRCEPLMA